MIPKKYQGRDTPPTRQTAKRFAAEMLFDIIVGVEYWTERVDQDEMDSITDREREEINRHIKNYYRRVIKILNIK